MISILNGGSRKELCPRSKLPALTAFRVIPIRTKYPRALSSCIMHTHRRWKQPLPTYRELDSPRPAEGRLPLLFLALSLRSRRSSLPVSLPDRVFRVILLCCDSIVAPTAYTVSTLRMLAFSSTCKKTHIRVRSSRGDTPDNTHTHTCIPPARGARGVYADTPST